MSKSTTFHLIMLGLGAVSGVLFAPRAGAATHRTEGQETQTAADGGGVGGA
jgi:hypothetical protein